MDFNSTNKFALSIVRDPHPEYDSIYCLMIKGAPDRVWDRSTKILVNGVEEDCTSAQWKKAYDDTYKYFARNG